MRKQQVVFITSLLGFALTLCGAMAQQAGTKPSALPTRPEGPCDVYGAAGDPCVAAHSTTRALYAAYSGPLYRVLRQSDGESLDIGIVQPVIAPHPDPGGYADAAAQDRFCANTYCWITTVYDQSPKHNDLTQAPRGGFSGPAMGGFNNLPLADMAPVTVMGHKVYGVFIAPGMGLRNDDPRGTAVDDQAEGQYWVINGLHFNNGCCFDYGNAEIDSRDDDNGTMETTYYGDATPWFHGNPPGPWVMTDQENNLVGCVNPDGSKLCANLPNISWRFVTAIAKGEPHHWTSLGGNAQKGTLSVMFDGPRVDGTYDPMRKQGAILLGNGGDNSNGSQGTFYEGAVTASGTFPTNETDQRVQANVVAAGYGVQRLSVTPKSAMATPPGLQTFAPRLSQEVTVTFTNPSSEPVRNLRLDLLLPNRQWTAAVQGSGEMGKSFSKLLMPGQSFSATFNVRSGEKPFNGDLIGRAFWTSDAMGERSETSSEKVRNVDQIKINEFRVGTKNATDTFIELFNSGLDAVDLSRWSMTIRPTQQAVFSSIVIPEGTKLKPGGFYLMELANSGLASAAHKGDTTLYLRSAADMTVGDRLLIGTGAGAETRKVVTLGTAPSSPTTLWQPLPDGPVITFPVGSTNVPVQSTAGFKVGDKIALGYGATYPSVGRGMEQYEIATVTAIGEPGTQAYLAEDAPVGATNIKVTSVSAISTGDKIRLDIDSPGHGIETVTVSRVGTEARQTNLTAAAAVGSTSIKVRRVEGFVSGDRITVGTPANHEEVIVKAVSGAEPNGGEMTFTPALRNAHIRDEWVVSPGSGLDLAAPLKFEHAANLPFSDRGTGIRFEPATAFPHSSDEPIQALGSGVVLDRPLAAGHAINTPVRDAVKRDAGNEGAPQPDLWFGGPELVTHAPLFGRVISVPEGSLVVRDSSGLVVDSVNYGGLVDPWAGQGYQAASGPGKGGCFAPTTNVFGGFRPGALAMVDRSAGRFPDGTDTESNCTDFSTQASTVLPDGASPGTTNIKVASVNGFHAGQTLLVDTSGEQEKTVIANVGTAGAASLRSGVSAGAIVLPVTNILGFSDGQIVEIQTDSGTEMATVRSVRRSFGGGGAINLATPVAHELPAGARIAGTGISLVAPLQHRHNQYASVTDNAPTPGAPNRFSVTVAGEGRN